MILINGDSWTGGPTYSNLNDHWPYQMSLKYKLPITNLAWGGASNQRIFRTTIEYLYSTVEIPTHLIIGWSFYERFEFPSIEGNYMRITPRSCETFIENDHPVPGIKDIKNVYYKYMYNIDLIHRSFINNLLIIQDLCRYKNIKLLNFNSSECRDSFLDDRIDNSTWLLPISNSMDEHLESLNFKKIASNHTDIEGQKFWADLVYKFI